MPDFKSIFRRRDTEWVRTSMRTPGILIFGMVMAPCGWVLNLVTTVAPNWRTLQDFPNLPPDRVIEQGIWDICIASTATERQQCGQEDTTYFGNDIIEISQGLMLGSLIVTLIGICVAIPGVRCWTERAPNWAVCTCAGFLIFISGVLTLIAVSWYTHIIDEITTATPLLGVRAGYCLVLGFIGGIFEVLGGFVMTLGCCRCCGGKNRGERPIEEVLGPRSQPKREPRRVDVPSLSRSRSSAANSVPSSYGDTLDDDVSFPRAKTPAARSAVSNPSFNGTPYDADL
ncbi:PREDICTED: claudin-23-like [Cyprinodon variegatus]|uniref:claudin-23-like n=1 Tax=Cyprinodon variegatus TaxID=28743 RepID=UPI000742B537|nr:PREDICTED: claudin-23-like [Cyprinodon variegatus]